MITTVFILTLMDIGLVLGIIFGIIAAVTYCVKEFIDKVIKKKRESDDKKWEDYLSDDMLHKNDK